MKIKTIRNEVQFFWKFEKSMLKKLRAQNKSALKIIIILYNYNRYEQKML